MTGQHEDAASAQPIQSVLARLTALGHAERVSVRDILEDFGETSYVPALMVPALIVVSPLSGIFFLPTVMGLIIAIIAVQMLFGRRFLWLPEILLRRSVSGPRLVRAAAWLQRPAIWFDRRTRKRLTLFFVFPLSLIPALGCMAAGLMMPFLELVPLSSSILGGAITLLAVAVLVRDGVFVVAGLASIGVASLIPLLIVFRFA